MPPKYPTIYNVETGQWEEVSPDEAREEYRIPIGPPGQYDPYRRGAPNEGTVPSFSPSEGAGGGVLLAHNFFDQFDSPARRENFFERFHR
jgi:hypothetical protein